MGKRAEKKHQRVTRRKVKERKEEKREKGRKDKVIIN